MTIHELLNNLKTAKREYRARIDQDPEVLEAKRAIGQHLIDTGLPMSELLAYVGTSNRATVAEYLQAAGTRVKDLRGNTQQNKNYWAEPYARVQKTGDRVRVDVVDLPPSAWSPSNATTLDGLFSGFAVWDREGFFIDGSQSLHRELLAGNPFFVGLFN